MRIPISRYRAGNAEPMVDEVADEEPLEIRLGEKPLCVTMRTPGEDFELAAGFLRSESVIRTRDDVVSIRHWGSLNVVRVALTDGVPVDLQRLQRHFYSTSSCGICGKSSIEAIRVHADRLRSSVEVNAESLMAMPDRVRREQKNFDVTGAIHAAGLFAADGTLLIVREDVGRHNAVDKAIGAMLMSGTPIDDAVLCVSGRAGFEIVQKAIVAKIPIVAAVGAPSSLAVELAREFNVTLAGFLRDGRFNVYAGQERVTR